MQPQVINFIIKHPQSLLQQQSKRYRLQTPKNPQQCFYQTILTLLHIKSFAQQLDQQRLQFLLKKSHGYSSLRLKYQYTRLAFEKNIDLSARKQYNIFQAVTNWNRNVQKQLSKDSFSFAQSLLQHFLYRNFGSFEDCIVFLDYVSSPHLISIIKTTNNNSDYFLKQKQGKESVKGQQKPTEQQSKKDECMQREQKEENKQENRVFNIKIGPKVSVVDLLNFVAVILPKTIYNVVIPKINFPENYFYKKNEYQGIQSIGILYRNENLESLVKQSKSYSKFVKQSLIVLLNSQLQQNMSKPFLLSVFNYYYLFHMLKDLQTGNLASKLVIRALKKLTLAVRYALTDQIYLFVRILIKLGKQDFLKELCQQFGQWFTVQILEKSKQLNLVGYPIYQLKPYPGKLFSFSSSVNVNPGQSSTRIIQVYHHYSLFYFRVKPAKDDITIRLLQLSEFESDQYLKQPKVHFVREKVDTQFSQPIQFFRPGIYAIQFDNSYSWLKEKLIQYQFSILVPMEIVQDKECCQKTEPWLNLLMANQQPNRIPQKNIIKKVVANEEKRNLAQKLSNISEKKNLNRNRQLLLLKVDFRAKEKVYDLFYVEKIKQNSSTKTYEYESKDPQIFKKKIKDIHFSDCREINIFGKLVSDMSELVDQFQNHKNIQLKIGSQKFIEQGQDQNKQTNKELEEVQTKALQ